jgi:HlyD family secretion protein
MKRIRKVMALVVVAAAAGAAVFLYVRHRAGAEDGVLRISGNIEVIDVQLSFKIPGRVDKRLVNEGETVKAGQPVALLESEDLRTEVAVRTAEVAQAKAALAELEAGSRPEEIAAAAAIVDDANVEVDRRKLDFERLSTLKQGGMAALQEYDMARFAYEAGKAKLAEARERLKMLKEGPRTEDIDQARAGLGQAQATYDLVKNGPRKEKIDQARAMLTQAEQGLATAETRMSYAGIASPIRGVVLSENVESGETVVAGTPVVTVADITSVYLRGYVSETDITKVRLGQLARITTDNGPRKSFDGHISFIASEAEFTPKNVQTEKERVKLVYRIKIDIPNPDGELKPGMPADAEILIK